MKKCNNHLIFTEKKEDEGLEWMLKILNDK